VDSLGQNALSGNWSEKGLATGSLGKSSSQLLGVLCLSPPEHMEGNGREGARQDQIAWFGANLPSGG